jgi:hypothetical protein
MLRMKICEMRMNIFPLLMRVQKGVISRFIIMMPAMQVIASKKEDAAYREAARERGARSASRSLANGVLAPNSTAAPSVYRPGVMQDVPPGNRAGRLDHLYILLCYPGSCLDPSERHSCGITGYLQ